MSRALLMVLALCWLGVATSAGAQAGLPDEAARERLRGSLGTARLVRVTIAGIRSIDRRAEVRPEGLLFTSREGWDTVLQEPRAQSLVTWERLNGLEVKRGRSDRWMWGGAIAGALIGAVIGQNDPDNESRGGQASTPFYALVGAGLGGGFGALIGASQDPWVRVWP